MQNLFHAFGWIIAIPYFAFRGDDNAVPHADGNLNGFLEFMGWEPQES